MGIADQVLGADEPKRSPRAAYSNNDPGPWKDINDLDPITVGDRLGIDHDGKKIRKCPHCGADGGVDFLDAGWKCLHASCSGMGKNGFRTNVDSIVELRECSPLDAARWAAAEFGTPAPGADQPHAQRTTTPKSDEPPDDFYDRMAGSIPEAADASGSANPTNGKRVVAETKVDIKTGIVDAFIALQERMKRGDKLAGVESGYRKLDYALDGFCRKKMYVIAGRAGMGKSVVGLNLALRFAEAGKRVLYFTIEMTNEEQVLRALFNRAKVGMWRMKKDKIFKEHWSALTDAAGTISKLPIHFDQKVGLTDLDIERLVIKHKQEHGGDLFCVVVDHTLLVHGTNQRQPRRDQLNGIIEHLHNIAKEHDVCVLALAQMNRALEARTVKDKRPQMSEIKETGAFEEFADATLLLYREDYYHYSDPSYKRDNVIEIILPKIRGGQGTKVELEFIGSQCRIEPPKDDVPEDDEVDNPPNYQDPDA
ncbi:MAG: DnaB-like helicase C-terminal domain-containing protein [Brevundimonas sp.]